MNLSVISLFIVLGIVVLLLGAYLGNLLVKLKEQKHKQDIAKEELEKKVASIKESIVLISRATIQKQCEISECVLRNYHLLKRLGLLDTYPVFNDVFKLIEEFDTLEARQKLTAKEAFEQDKKRFKVERENKEQVITECKRLIQDLS